MARPRRKTRASAKQSLGLDTHGGFEAYVKATEGRLKLCRSVAQDHARAMLLEHTGVTNASIEAVIAKLEPDAQKVARSTARGRLEFQLQARGGLEVQLQAAEKAAHRILEEHTEVVGEAIAKLTPEVQDVLRHTFGGVFNQVPIVEHNEPRRRSSKLPARACERCEAAHRLLFHLRELRYHLNKGDAETAVLYALSLGRLQLRLGLVSLEDDAERGAEERKQRTKGGEVLYGGAAGKAWRTKRDDWVVSADKKLRQVRRKHKVVQEARWKAISKKWNEALANGDVPPPPYQVKGGGELTTSTVHSILVRAGKTRVSS
jgi:hypothetical protein